MTKFICTVLIALNIFGCSTNGGIYKSGDAKDGEFSAGRTALTVLGVIGAAAIAKGGGGGGYQDQGYAWDYQPGNGQWVCRNKANGQYAHVSNCASLPKVDNWP